MVSLLIPPSIQVSIAPGYVKREGPRGSFVKKTGDLLFQKIQTSEGTRLFLFNSSKEVLPDQEKRNTSTSTLNSKDRKGKESKRRQRFSLLSAQRKGLSRGYRRRLRLVGVGFRAVSTSLPSEKKDEKRTPTISLKLGYSHDVLVPSSVSSKTQERKVIPSRLDGRSKGTLLRLEGTDSSKLNYLAATIRNFRRPDPYKGKGIHYNKEVLRLKKGKRES